MAASTNDVAFQALGGKDLVSDDAVTTPGLIAAIGTTNDVELADASATKLVGIYGSTCSAGGRARILPLVGFQFVRGASGVAKGDRLTADANARAVATTTDTEPFIGVAMEAAAADDDLILVACAGAGVNLAG